MANAGYPLPLRSNRRWLRARMALLPDLQAAGRHDPYLYYRWNLHWTAAGHRVVAATLARELEPR